MKKKVFAFRMPCMLTFAPADTADTPEETMESQPELEDTAVNPGGAVADWLSGLYK